MEKFKIEVHPLSINKAWKGKRFKTKEYEDYEDMVTWLLPSNIKIPDGKLFVKYCFGLSSSLADYDNPIKPFQDIISKFYGFNDKMIFKVEVEKKLVPKGQEYITFEILKYEEPSEDIEV